MTTRFVRTYGVRIYIAGRRHSGKDTAADALVTSLPGIAKVKLTDPVYTLARAWGMQGKDRALLQQAGDLLRSTFGPDILAAHTVLRTLAGSYVCPDIRLPREAEILRGQGWVGIRIERPEAERIASLVAAGESVDGPEARHHTEMLIDAVPVDVVIVNDGTVEDLARRTVQAVSAFYAGIGTGGGA